MFKILVRTIMALGFNPVQFLYSLKGIPAFIRDYINFRKLRSVNSDFNTYRLSPCLGDRYEQGGDMNSVYFQQDLYIAQKIFLANPTSHLDIGSRTDGFVAHVATFRSIDVADIRDIQSNVTNIHFRQADLMQPVSFENFKKYDSISSLHAIEHFGLGRYGDPIDLNGHNKALGNIFSLLNDFGVFYFSVPIGEQRIEFNAHRVFNLKYLMKLFEGKFNLLSFSYIDDKKILHKNVQLTDEEMENSCGCDYGCGIFVLSKVSVSP